MKKRISPASTILVPENLLTHEPGSLEPEVWCDFDGVIVDWLTPFLKFASQILGRDLDPRALRFYHPQHQANMPITPSDFDELFYRFAGLSRGGYSDREAYPGMVKAIGQIAAAGIRVRIATWAPGASELSPAHSKAFATGAAQNATLRLIEKLHLPVTAREVEFVAPGKKASRMAEEGVPLIIEDCPSTAVQVVMEYGMGAVLMPQPYNKGLAAPGIIRLGKRSDLASTVIRFFEILDAAGVLATRRA